MDAGLESPTVTLIPRAPLSEVVGAVEWLIRRGLPPMMESPEWPRGQQCPDGHWLAPPGTRLYCYDEGEEVQSPAVLISIEGDAAQRYPNSRLYWNVPLKVQLVLARKPGRQEIETIHAKLVRMLTESLPTGDPRTVQPWDRLTAAGLEWAASEDPPLKESVKVFTHGFRDVDAPALQAQNGHVILELTTTVVCGTCTELPPAA